MNIIFGIIVIAVVLIAMINIMSAANKMIDGYNRQVKLLRSLLEAVTDVAKTMEKEKKDEDDLK